MSRHLRAVPSGALLMVGSLGFLILLVALVHTSRPSMSPSSPQSHHPILHYYEEEEAREGGSSMTTTTMKLEPQLDTIDGMQVSWFLPPPSDQGAPPIKGAFMLFHGCTRHYTDWHTYPEERRILHLLLSRDYAVICLQQTTGVCWDTGLDVDGNPDLRRAKAVTGEMVERLGLHGLPLYAMGASSGGSFSMVFPMVAPVLGVVVQISPGVPEAIPLWLPSPSPPNSGDHEDSLTPQGAGEGQAMAPRVCFLYMTKDTRWASEANIAKTREILESKGHPVLVLAADGPKLDQAFFSSRMPGQVTPEESSLLFAALVDSGFAHCQGGEAKRCELISDPRQSGVLQALASGVGKGEEGRVVAEVMGRYHDYIEELLNVLWNSHEITSEKMGVWLDYVVGGSSGSSNSGTEGTEEAA